MGPAGKRASMHQRQLHVYPGPRMPYHHPVAVVMCALWWGFFLGCLRESVGPLIALFSDPAPAPRCRGVDGGTGTPLHMSMIASIAPTPLSPEARVTKAAM
jgi:hypothetical protein